MPKFIKKPVVIEAIQLRQDTINECLNFVGENGKIDPTDGKFKIETLEGTHIANINNWIIKGVKGEFYPCKPDIFEATYDSVEEKDV